MLVATDSSRAVADHFCAAIGITAPRVSTFVSNSGKGEVFLLSAEDTPDPGVRTLSTVGLSAHPMIRNGGEFPVRVEIYGACYSRFEIFNNVLTSAAFEMMSAGWICLPGVIFPGLFGLYPGASTTMSDLFFANPYGWAERLRSFKVEERTVAWLMAVPISAKETEFVREHGSDRFVDHLAQANIDVFDLNRPSTL